MPRRDTPPLESSPLPSRREESPRPSPTQRTRAERGAGQARGEGELQEIEREQLLERRLQSEADIEAQKKWQSEGNAALRHAKRVFDTLVLPSPLPAQAGQRSPVKGERAMKYRALGLPDTDALIADLARAAQDAEYVPTDEWHKEITERLRHYRATEGEPETDVLKLLASAQASASARLEFFQKEIAGFIEYTEGKDREKLLEVEPQMTEDREQKTEEGEPPLELPPPQEDEMRTSMDELEKGKEGEKPRGYFSVHPFWGGYYREQVYETHIGGARWKKEERQYGKARIVEKLVDERVYRGSVRGGAVTDVPVPYGFALDAATFKAGGKVQLKTDQNGNWVVDARGAEGVIIFTVLAGKPKSTLTLPSRGGRGSAAIAVRETFAGAEAQAMLGALSGTAIEKARAIKRFVQGSLKYSNESVLNAVYEGEPDGYFAAIEKHKKADCDVANAYYINLLSAAEIEARLAVGHYVKMKDADGAAVMYSGSRHAWSEVWDDAEQKWMRFDATPAGDPTLDEDRPDEMSEDESGPGDYGEQEAKQITEEELAEFKKKIDEAKHKAQEATASPEERQNKEFAEKAGCTPEQAKRVREKIAEARALRDAQGRNVRDSMAEEFQTIVDSNLKDVMEYRGPVTRSQGDVLEDKKMAAKDVRAGIADPLGYAREVIEQKLAQEYGGMDVWLVVDRSGSMDEIDPLTNRPKKEEQQLAGFLALDGINAFSYKTEAAARQDLLLSPMSVRTVVVAFQGGSADMIKPPSGTWTEKEQYEVWSKMESNIGGGTPAHLGLMRVCAEIERLRAGDKKRPGPPYQKPRLQVVMVFMDGGVSNVGAYLAEQKKLEDMGVYVSSWGMTESARTVEAYPQGHCVPSARQMIAPISKYIVGKARQLKM